MRCAGEILILGYTAPERAGEIRRYDLAQTLIDHAYACRLNEQGQRIKVHVKIDTGMHRLGFDPFHIEEILCVFAMERFDVRGIYTHLCAADSLEEEDVCFTRQQIADFYGVLKRLKKEGIRIPKIHIQSSYGLLNYPELKCSYVRAGIALYGVLSTPDAQTRLQPDLRPVLSLKAKVVLIRFVPQGSQSVTAGLLSRSGTASSPYCRSAMRTVFRAAFPAAAAMRSSAGAGRRSSGGSAWISSRSMSRILRMSRWA